MIGTTLGYEGMGSLVLFLIGDRAPDRGEWKSYVEFLKERVATHGRARLIVIAGSGGPDALQRKQLSDVVTPRQLRTAVVSDSIVARGVVTAFRWYGLDVQAFKTSAVDEAYAFAGATPEEVEWLRRTYAALRAGVLPPQAASR